jgi:hypothetical protein
MKTAKSFLVITFLLIFISVKAQQVSWYENQSGFPFASHWQLETRGHSSIKPYLSIDMVGEHIREDGSLHTFLVRANTWKNVYRKPYSNEEGYEPGGNMPFVIRPVYDLQGGRELNTSRTLYNAVAGIVIDADYKQKLGIELRLAGGMFSLANYQDSIARLTNSMPGWGDQINGSNGKYSFSHLSGNLIWRPTKVFNLQIGRDKHFWGDGYRSLFLSDAAAPVPYIKQQTTIWKLQYTSLFAAMNSYAQDSSLYKNKFGSFHYISFNAAKWLNIGVFESVIWQGEDQNRWRAFDANYLNPIVFFRPVEYSLGSSDNAMLGFAMNIRFNSNNQFYAQLILDEFFLKEIKNWKAGWWANKQGIQLGYKCFNMFRVNNMYMQTELNIVRPYTYTHGSVQQNYSHAGMPLAHPMGANFAEMIGILSYQIKGLSFTGKLIGIRYGLDPAGKNYGQNIFLSYLTRDSPVAGSADYNHKLFDGIGTNIFYAEFKAAYRLNTAFPIRFELRAAFRTENNSVQRKKSSFVLAGLSLPLWRTGGDY